MKICCYLRKQTFFMLVLFSALNLSAATIKDYMPNLTEKELVKLMDNKVVSNYSTKSSTLKYLPKASELEKRVSVIDIKTEDLFVECVTVIPLSSSMQKLPNEQRILKVFNTIRATSTQEGITYISYRKGNKPALLIKDSYYVARVGSKRPIPDPIADSLPSYEQSIIYQKDTTFSGNFYEYTYFNSSHEISLDILNKTALAVFGILPAVKKEALTMSISILPVEEGILCYSLAYAPDQEPVISFLGLSVDLPSAFQRRMVAVQEWFAAKQN